MNWNNVFTVYRKEFRDSLRDRRTVLSTVLIPSLMIPALFFVMGKVMKNVITKTEAEIPAVTIVGGGDSPGIVAQLQASKKLHVVPFTPDYQQKISDKKLRAAVELPVGFEAGLKSGATQAVTIYNFDQELQSNHGARALEEFLDKLRDKTVEDRLTEKALPEGFARPFTFKRQNVAPPEKVGGNTFGGFIPYLIIIVCFTGAMYPAMDLSAGEKERGTMETLLCSPVGRTEIVLGKFFMVLTGSLSAMFFMLLSMSITAFSVGSMFAGGSGAAKLAQAASAAKAAGSTLPTIDPLGLVGVLGMVLPTAVLFAAAAFTVALFAKSYKEAQSYLAPMMIVVIMPAVVGTLPGIELNLRLALVPLLSLSLVCKEMLSGVWHWDYIALIFGSSCVYAGIALALAVKMFNRESVLFRA